jgi:hypothetical protein
MIAVREEAFRKASALPEKLQGLLAKELLAVIESETRWDKTLADSQPLLDQLTANAMREYRNCK